jgi:hypothetical protein
MYQLRTVRPSPSYTVSVPDAAREEHEGRVSSYWLDGEPVLLQLSSYLRLDGPQVAAHERLQDRMKRHPATWTVWSRRAHPAPSVDQATADWVDQNQILWVNSYLVWPHLTVYALVSGPESRVRESDTWAHRALRSIELAVH